LGGVFSYYIYQGRGGKRVAGDYDVFRNDTAIKEKHKEELKEPDMFRVLLFNDHYTTQEFVVGVIMTVFNKSVSEAMRIMLDVHRKGKGVVGVYSYDIAATKAGQVRALAKAREYPLKCTVEKA
jgi:ATP-dependent Clp protease adaptor protein ClpS